MKKPIYLFFALTLFFACNNESTTQQEGNTDLNDEMTISNSDEMIEETIQTSEIINMPADVLWPEV